MTITAVITIISKIPTVMAAISPADNMYFFSIVYNLPKQFKYEIIIYMSII